MEMCGKLHVPVALSLRLEFLVPIGYKAGWVPEPVWAQWREEKGPIIAPAGNRTPVVLAVAQ
jgi:hypothetical protein